MESIIYTNEKGQSITLQHKPPFVLQELRGTGAVNVDVQTQRAPFQDGETHIDSLMEMRSISLDVFILDADIYTKKAEISRVFNPKLKGTLRYEYNGVIKEIEAVNEYAPDFPSGKDNKGANYQKALISLLCPSPFWLSELIQEEPMAAFVGLFEFPLEILEEGIEMGAQAEQRTIENNGDVSAPVEIEFRGPALNPRIQNNTTDEFIQVNQELQSGETLHINTAFGKKRVEIEDTEGDRTNAFNWIDLDSVFWQLEPGENELEYSADTGQDDATVTIRWRERFVGV